MVSLAYPPVAMHPDIVQYELAMKRPSPAHLAANARGAGHVGAGVTGGGLCLVGELIRAGKIDLGKAQVRRVWQRVLGLRSIV